MSRNERKRTLKNTHRYERRFKRGDGSRGVGGRGAGRNKGAAGPGRGSRGVVAAVCARRRRAGQR